MDGGCILIDAFHYLSVIIQQLCHHTFMVIVGGLNTVLEQSNHIISDNQNITGGPNIMLFVALRIVGEWMVCNC